MKKDSNEKNSIGKFVAKKDKLLTAFGIFLAITLFTKDIQISDVKIGEITFGEILSFIFFSLTLLIWIELWGSFPSKNRTWTLILFENLINIGTPDGQDIALTLMEPICNRFLLPGGFVIHFHRSHSTM